MKTILYIDESESYRFLLKEELPVEGYQVVKAESTEKALSKFGRVNPDLIFLELRQKRPMEGDFDKSKDRYPGFPWTRYCTKKWEMFSNKQDEYLSDVIVKIFESKRENNF